MYVVSGEPLKTLGFGDFFYLVDEDLFGQGSKAMSWVLVSKEMATLWGVVDFEVIGEGRLGVHYTFLFHPEDFFPFFFGGFGPG